MAKITHFARIKAGRGVNYYLKGYHLTATEFKGIDEETASYLRKLDAFEVKTAKQAGKAPEEPKNTKKE